MINKVVKIFCLLLPCLLLISCENNSNNEVKEENYQNPYVLRKAIDEKENGWVYYGLYGQLIDDPTDYSFSFSAVNVKYKTMKDYRIEVVEEESHEVIDYVDPAIVDITMDEEYNREYALIQSFFRKKDYKGNVTLEDMKDLNIVKFDKKEIVKLYNEAYNQEVIKLGKFDYLPAEHMECENEYLDGYKWQIAHILRRANIAYINIELIYSDGTYLSDKIANNTASKEQKEINQKIQTIEQYMVDNQTFFLDDETASCKIGNIEFARLGKISSSNEVTDNNE